MLETIVKIGGEDGSFTLLGHQEGESWSFYRLRDESVLPAELLGTNLAAALAELTPRWTRMRPIVVHPEFQWKIYREVLRVRPEDEPLWQKACTQNNPTYALAHLMATSRNTVVLTGAGMSTESGLPDFRSKDGWWRSIDPLTVATIDALENNYEVFRDFYQYRIEMLQRYEPHEGHAILAKWEQEGLLHSIATQNVDGFHTDAGSVRVAELHGNLTTIRCHACGKPAEPASFLADKACEHCKGRLRPAVVLFGESLPEHSWNQALQWFHAAELVIVIGTSLQVAPTSQLPRYISGRSAYINLDIEGAESFAFDFVIQGRAKRTLTELDDMLTFILDTQGRANDR